MPDETIEDAQAHEPEPGPAPAESRTFTAPAGTDIATTVGDGGERVDIAFPSGKFTTSDEAVIEVLARLASDPEHPVEEA